MLGRYLKWSTPKTGVAFLVNIDAVIKAHNEFWRPFDHCFAETLLSLTQHAAPNERIEVWGGIYHESGETHYMVLISGTVPSSETVNAVYGQLRLKLPEGAIYLSGAPSLPSSLLPIYAITEGTVYRCAVTEDGTAPTLRVLLKSPEGPVIGQFPAVPVNLAAMLDKVPGVSLLIADLSPETGDAGITEDGDRIGAQTPHDASSSTNKTTENAVFVMPGELSVAADEMVVSAVAIYPGEETETMDSSVGSVKIVDSDVVFIQEVGHPAESAPPPFNESMAPLVELSQEALVEEAPSDDMQIEPISDLSSDNSDSEIPTAIREPQTSAPQTSAPQAPSRAPSSASSQGDGPGTLIDVGDDDIASAKMMSGAGLATMTDSELRLILTSAPLEETCQKLAAVLQKQPSDIARIFALASGAPAVPGPETSLALRARTVASVVGWVLAPKH